MARFCVAPEQAGERVDHLVAAALPGVSVAAARRLIEGGAVRIDGRSQRKKGARLMAGQTVEVEDGAPPDGEPPRARPAPEMPLTVLQVEEEFVAIDKPAGVPSHPHAPQETGTAVSALVARFPECATASPDPREGGLVHRLDTGTSGVLIAARSAAAWARLRASLAAPGCEKTYLAEVTGSPPDHGASDASIGRIGRRGARVRVGGGRNPLPAHTAWEVVERRGDTTLVRVRLSKGRAHQVRAHLAAAGFPIVGDDLYGGAPGGARLRLHAAAVRFPDPASGRPVFVTAPPPDWAMMRP